ELARAVGRGEPHVAALDVRDRVGHRRGGGRQQEGAGDQEGTGGAVHGRHARHAGGACRPPREWTCAARRTTGTPCGKPWGGRYAPPGPADDRGERDRRRGGGGRW